MSGQDLETKTLNGELFEEGFTAIKVVPNTLLPEKLTEIMVKFLRRKYLDIRIVPGDVALRGSPYRPKEPSHIVYAKENSEHPNFDPEAVSVLMPFLIDETGTSYMTIPLKTIK